MTPRLLFHLLRVLRCVSIKHLLGHCRSIWAFLWNACRKRVSCIRTQRGPRFRSPEATEPKFGSLEAERFQQVESWRDATLPVVCALAPPMASPIAYSTTRDLSDTTSIDIPLQVIPPDSPASESRLERHHIESRPSHDDSATLASDMENDISHQIFLLQPSLITGSRVSLVLPTAPSLRHEGDVAHIGTSGATGFSDGISDFIYCIMPTKIPRYKRDRKIDTKPAEFELNPAQQSFSLGDLPRGWEQITHPEGQPYFYHTEKRIITENWIWDPREMRVLDDFIASIEDFARSRNLYQPADTHIILECTEEDGQWWCGYYYACASSRSLFWLEKHDINRFLDEVRGEIHPTHIKLYLEYQYWYHWDLFPNVNKATSEIFDLVANTIADARTDVQTSKQTTVNYSTEDLREMADIVECASKRMNRANSSWCLGRFMTLFVRDQFLNFHGQYGARLSRSQSIYSGYKRHPRTWFIKALSPALFASPNVHLSALEELWVDRLTLKARCVEFFSKLNTEWGEHIVHASILLNANVAFLAIPSNDPSNNTSPTLPLRYPAQIASYLSVVTSFASMMIGLLLVRQHKKKERATVTVGEFHTYLRDREHPVFGFEQLASIYSLPYALLTWAMGSFLVAFMLLCFQVSTTTTRSIVGVAIGLVCVLIVWCIWMAWEETEFHWRRWFKAKLRSAGGDSEESEAGTKNGVASLKRSWLWSWPERVCFRARGQKQVDDRSSRITV